MARRVYLDKYNRPCVTKWTGEYATRIDEKTGKEAKSKVFQVCAYTGPLPAISNKEWFELDRQVEERTRLIALPPGWKFAVIMTESGQPTVVYMQTKE